MEDKDFFSVKKNRPEELFEDSTEYFRGKKSSQYASSKSMMRIQQRITLRAIELLGIKIKSARILDAGSGAGFSSSLIKDFGFDVISLDINQELLYHYKIRDLNPVLGDIRNLPFRSEIFDGIISISVMQWIFRPPITKEKKKTLINMMNYFYTILKKDSKAIFQFYPKNDVIMKEMGSLIKNSTNFRGGFIIDNPKNYRKRKVFLLLKKF